MCEIQVREIPRFLSIFLSLDFTVYDVSRGSFLCVALDLLKFSSCRLIFLSFTKCTNISPNIATATFSLLDLLAYSCLSLLLSLLSFLKIALCI